ncbi:MAG: isoprenyl transferase [Candidatus Marinimicrobia bacterium]|jgi:undecaprenyl diphosphate synthase|nr:isoprenyl transferase [Candidatus Neomarinimicrobiota bacterium]MCK9483245.1 isoprenyl transferase [Candidatus Neomarinimicrobiota bacterium]MCK9559864.1 isoprenyl transferase [Candidatus Neomarinimicrobiota bacterium]MDD5060950.1 isoprenyl transferase [Candidatus Neomarinimicrobiota bacterium]MDD5229829.1 isoprenyl transferase [Candidatus Neomarinimicrobiota bacterium]
MSKADQEIASLREQVLARGELPRHIAIIMDGNGRWAKRRGLPRVAGHNEGINSVREITRECGQIGIKVLTLYTFSIENWSRPKSEVTYLMTLLLRTIRNEVNELHKNNVRLTLMGHLADLPDDPLKGLLEGVEKTSLNTGLNLNLALSYGGRAEILDATRTIAQNVREGRIALEDIDERLFSSYLYTRDIPDPDLLIRTSGELRISNFLLWQMAYAELYVTETLWPDFRNKELLLAISEYQKRERRFGKTSEQITHSPGI